MVKRIAVVALTKDDFLSAPTWVKEMLEAYSQGGSWDIQVFHEVSDAGSIEQMVDLQVGDTSYLYGPLPMVMRHVARSNLATIARGSILIPTAEGLTPFTPRFLEAVKVLVRGMPQEAAWLLDLEMGTVMSLAQLEEWTPEALLTICETMEPECRGRWANNHQQALTAVALL